MITSTFILKKTASSYDNIRTAMLRVFIFADDGAGVGIHTTVHILGRISGTGNRHPIPMGRVPTVSYKLVLSQ